MLVIGQLAFLVSHSQLRIFNNCIPVFVPAMLKVLVALLKTIAKSLKQESMVWRNDAEWERVKSWGEISSETNKIPCFWQGIDQSFLLFQTRPPGLWGLQRISSDILFYKSFSAQLIKVNPKQTITFPPKELVIPIYSLFNLTLRAKVDRRNLC